MTSRVDPTDRLEPRFRRDEYGLAGTSGNLARLRHPTITHPGEHRVRLSYRGTMEVLVGVAVAPSVAMIAVDAATDRRVAAVAYDERLVAGEGLSLSLALAVELRRARGIERAFVISTTPPQTVPDGVFTVPHLVRVSGRIDSARWELMPVAVASQLALDPEVVGRWSGRLGDLVALRRRLRGCTEAGTAIGRLADTVGGYLSFLAVCQHSDLVEDALQELGRGAAAS